MSSANQHPVDETYPYYVFNDGYETYRNRVINTYFNSKEKFSVADFKALQKNNNYNLKASELVPYMLSQMDTSSLSDEEKGVYKEISAWTFNNDINEVGPSIWTLWYGHLEEMLWDEFNDEQVALTTPYTYQTIHLLKTQGNHAFMDIVATEDKTEKANDLFLLSFKEAVKNLSVTKLKGDYTWGGYEGTYVGHLLQGLPAFSPFDIPRRWA